MSRNKPSYESVFAMFGKSVSQEQAPLYLLPYTSAPTRDLKKGLLAVRASDGALMICNGTSFVEAGSTVTDASVFSGTLAYRRPVTSLTAAGPTAITAAMSGYQFNFNRAAGVAVTLPAVTASEVGVFYDFFFETTATGDHTITAQAADLLIGGVNIQDFDTANTGTYFAADGSDDLIITCNGSTKGGKKGSHLRLTCSSATSWTVQGYLYGDGSLATPFS